jgi:hypothetical protein
MQSKHNRKIVFSGIDMVGASMDHSHKCYEKIRNLLESLMIDSGYLENAPFLWVGVVFGYGLKTEIKPHYQRINKKYGDLPVNMELDMRVLLTTDAMSEDLLYEFLLIAALDVLIHAGKKYKLKTAALEEIRSELGNIPEWEFEMEDDPSLIEERYLATKPHSH